MTIYAPRPAPFTCAICREPQMDESIMRFFWGGAANYPIPPLCNPCSRRWGKSIGGLGDLNRDRRIARQISALAEALTAEAHRAPYKRGPLNG